jgi:hypothetical protein
MRKVSGYLGTAVVTFVLGVTCSFLISSNRLNGFRNISFGQERDRVKPFGSPQLRRVYINKDLRWESPPKEIIEDGPGGYKYTVNERLLVFFPDGRFASILCTIYQANGDQKRQFIPNAGFAVFKGSWALSDSTITITSRLWSSNKVATPSIAQMRQERLEQISIPHIDSDRIAKDLDLNGRLFVPTSEIDGMDELLSFPDGEDW